jgi:cyclopropane-fatty-acyl-phospholipid synthase
VVYQLQLTKRFDTLPLTRDYLREREDALRAAEFRRDDFRLAGE